MISPYPELPLPESHSRPSAMGPDIDLDTAVEDQLTVAHVAKFQPHSRAQYGTQVL
jgi:hypothetical protein